MNNITIIGRMGKDAELRQTASGKTVANFSVAVNRRGDKDSTDWFNVTAWEKTADFVSQYLGKGRLVAVQGRMQQRKYTTQDGREQTVWDLVASEVQALDWPDDKAAKQPAPHPPTDQEIDEYDPFADE